MMGSDDELTLEEESELHRLAYEAGDKVALLWMMRHCHYMHWPVPEWALQALTDALDRIEAGAARSWNEVFGEPRPRGTHAWTAQLDHRKYAIYVSVRAIVEREGKRIDTALFERVGRETGLGSASTIRERYYQVDHIIRRLNLTIVK
jgi:hypothetical protein